MNDKSKLVYCGIISIIGMSIIGVIAKICGLDWFIINTASLSPHLTNFLNSNTYLCNSIMLWINLALIMLFCINEYTPKTYFKIILTFPIVLMCNGNEIIYSIIFDILFSFALVSLIKIKKSTIFRYILLYFGIFIYQLTSILIKTDTYTLAASANNINIVKTFIYSIDLNIFILVFILVDRYLKTYITLIWNKIWNKLKRGVKQ